MNVPLNWLAEYVDLPKDTKVLTDKLTMIGHMLDKTKNVDGETVIDLELRGNRADMFGLIGTARDVAAAFDTKLKLPPITPIPPTNPKSPLVKVEPNAKNVVHRYTALTLKIKVGPSPDWLIQRLKSLDIPSINNVVDITNFVMYETGEPMHAFDLNKLAGKHLILHRAKKDEKFSTIQQGQIVSLSPDDLVICDDAGPEALTMIGGLNSKVTSDTTDILLEAAVYDQANSRRTAKRLKIFTDSGVRHEKLLDPNQVEAALKRSVHLLQKLANAKITSDVSDYYPHPISPKTIDFDTSEVSRLTGSQVSDSEIKSILTRLEFKASGHKITVPTFRTDVESSADLVEEVIRIHGYNKVPSTPLSGQIPEPATYPSYAIQETIKNHLTSVGLDEVITLSMIPNSWAPDGIKLVNPPDPDSATLRPSLHHSLATYAQKLLDYNQPHAAVFEIGKTFQHHHKNLFTEKLSLGIAIGGQTAPQHWKTSPRSVEFADLKGIVDTFQKLMGAPRLNIEYGSQDNIFWTEINVDELLKEVPAYTNNYSIVSKFTPIIEDINVTLNTKYDTLINQIKKSSPLIKQVDLIDKYGDKLTLRLTFHSDTKQLSSSDLTGVREALGRLQ